MTLFSHSETLPAPKPGWDVWGQTSSGQVVKLGEIPKLGFGERLLKKYKLYYHVDTTEQTRKFDCDARSATGEMYFKVSFNVVFRVKPDKAPELFNRSDAIEAFLRDEMVREAQDLSERFHAEDDRAFQQALKDIYDPRSGGGFLPGPFELLRVGVLAQVPEGVRATDEMLQKSKYLDQRIITAEADGNTEEADRLRRARAEGQDIWSRTAQVSIGTADNVAQMQKRINTLLAEGLSPDSEQIRALEQKQKDMTKSSLPPSVVEDGTQTTDPEPPKIAQQKSDDLD